MFVTIEMPHGVILAAQNEHSTDIDCSLFPIVMSYWNETNVAAVGTIISYGVTSKVVCCLCWQMKQHAQTIIDPIQLEQVITYKQMHLAHRPVTTGQKTRSIQPINTFGKEQFVLAV